MNVNSVSMNNYTAVQGNTKASGIAFCGKQKADSVEIRSNKTEVKPSFLKTVFDKLGFKTGYERDMEVNLPYVLDMVDIRVGIRPKKVAALCIRYGNSDISLITPNVLDKVKSYLTESGIERKDDNLKLVKIGDSDKSRYAKKLVSYYDEASDKSIVFNELGEPNYKVRYEYDKLGAIKDYDLSDVYFRDTNEWEAT